MFNTTHPFYLEFIRSLNLSWREGCDLTYPGPAVSLSRMLMFVLFIYFFNGDLCLVFAIDVYIFAPPSSPPPNCFICPSKSILLLFSSLMLLLSPSLLTNQSYGLVFPWVIALSPLYLHLSLLLISPGPNAAVVGADVWCSARGGGGSAGIEPQSGNRSEAAQLQLASDLAARDESHELPAHGNPFTGSVLARLSSDIKKHSHGLIYCGHVISSKNNKNINGY